MNIHAFLEPLITEFEMFGPLERNPNEEKGAYVDRVKTTKRKHTLRVTRVIPKPENGGDGNELLDNTLNEWAGAESHQCEEKTVKDKYGAEFVVFEADVILFLAAITCDMPQRDKTMNRGGTGRLIGCGWCLLEVSAEGDDNRQ